MKKIIPALAVSLMLSTSALAASHMQAFTEYSYTENDLRASELIGMRIYATENEVGENDMIADGGETEWDDIGEVNDVILSMDGSVRAVILGVGGFLGIGEKDVAVEMDRIRIVHEEGDSDDFFLVVNANKALLEEAPAFKRDDTAMDDSQQDGDTATASAEGEQAETMEGEQTAEGEQAEEQSMAQNTEGEEAGEQTASTDTDATNDTATEREMLMPPQVEREGYQTAAFEDLTTENLTGARVYGKNDEDVGEVHELIVNTDGQITEAVIDVGGFLGIGEHRIAVTFDELQVIHDETWGDVRVYIDASQEALEEQPEYEG